MKRVLTLALLTLVILGVAGCAFLDTIGVDVAVTQFTAGWQNLKASPFENVFADTVSIDGIPRDKANAISYMTASTWWNGFSHSTFVAGTPTFPDDDHATTTVDFTVTNTATSDTMQVQVTLGLTRLQGWKIHSITIADDWRF